jgi:hypothetical protein
MCAVAVTQTAARVVRWRVLGCTDVGQLNCSCGLTYVSLYLHECREAAEGDKVEGAERRCKKWKEMDGGREGGGKGSPRAEGQPRPSRALPVVSKARSTHARTHTQQQQQQQQHCPTRFIAVATFFRVSALTHSSFLALGCATVARAGTLTPAGVLLYRKGQEPANWELAIHTRAETCSEVGTLEKQKKRDRCICVVSEDVRSAPRTAQATHTHTHIHPNGALLRKAAQRVCVCVCVQSASTSSACTGTHGCASAAPDERGGGERTDGLLSGCNHAASHLRCLVGTSTKEDQRLPWRTRQPRGDSTKHRAKSGESENPQKGIK